MQLLEVVWNFDPSVFEGYRMPAWYGIMWALSFYIGFVILNRMYKSEGVPEKWMDKTFIYVLVGGVLGARLGHCLFYQPDYYLAHPVEILKIWEGGLASHGGALGIIIAAYLLARNVTKTSILWVLDRLVVPAALAGGLIRLGNLFNHEIVGKPTGTDFGFKFLRHDIPSYQALQITRLPEDQVSKAYDLIANNPAFAEVLAAVPNRYPAQLFESICYFLVFGGIFYLYWKTNAAKLRGFLLGFFFVIVFGARFIIEFIKENQDGIDQQLEGLNMGQYLSIPLVLIGLFLMGRKMKQLKKGKDSEVVE
ncbi:MAG: prolipoprotein diacylglyceryl transferase [Crocinitomicaceae bacterium]